MEVSGIDTHLNVAGRGQGPEFLTLYLYPDKSGVRRAAPHPSKGLPAALSLPIVESERPHIGFWPGARLLRALGPQLLPWRN